MYIFISHSSKNEKEAGEVCSLLEKNGYSCFIAPRDIRPGREYAEELVNAIDKTDAMIVLLSEAANRSPHVLREIERAVSRSIPIIIYKLESVELTKSMEYFLMTHQWINEEKDIHSILECIKDMENEKHEDGKTETITFPVMGKKPEKKKPGKLIYPIAAVLFAVILGVSVYLIKGSTGDNNQKSDKIKEENTFANTDKEKTDTEKINTAKIKIGDTVKIGTYLGEKISWKVIKISEDGKDAVLITDNILTMKAFDAPEGGAYNSMDGKTYWGKDDVSDTDYELQIKVRGSSTWSNSNICTWLNSEKTVVEYKDQAPVQSAMSEKKNGYSSEAGFLSGFLSEELAAIKTVDVCTKGNAAAEDDYTVSENRVFLLSMEELEWLEKADVSILAKPTEAAAEQDKTKWYKAYSLDMGIEEYNWLLREPLEDSACRVYAVGNGYTEANITEVSAGVEGYGIRPAVTVDIDKLMALQ